MTVKPVFDKEYFEKYAAGESYEKAGDQVTFNYLDVATAVFLSFGLNKLDNLRLLDVGCADGRLMSNFDDHNWQTIGIENSEYILSKKLQSKNVIRGDMYQILYDGYGPHAKNSKKITLGKFDVILMNILMYLQPEDTMKLLKLVLEFYSIKETVFGVSMFYSNTSKVGENPYIYAGKGWYNGLDPDPVMARPKVYWIDLFSQLGLKPIYDPETFEGMYLVRGKLNKGNGEKCTINYPVSWKPYWANGKNLTDPVQVIHEPTGYTFNLSVDDENRCFIEHGNQVFSQREHIIREEAIPDLMSLVRSGALGPLTDVKFRLESYYQYVYGTFLAPENGSYQRYADYEITGQILVNNNQQDDE
jgi:hypothetical protein